MDKPYRQHRLSTLFLHVPAVDWPAVKRGLKTEFRSASSRANKTQLWSAKTPTPVVAYTTSRRGHEAQLMVLEATWMEPLGAISAESLAREGFGSLAEYRRYWMRREHKRFLPTSQGFVYRIRPWRDDDAETFAALLLGRLYGEFLPGWEDELGEAA